MAADDAELTPAPATTPPAVPEKRPSQLAGLERHWKNPAVRNINIKSILSPLEYKSPEELLAKGLEYFAWATENGRPYTLERLALFLGFYGGSKKWEHYVTLPGFDAVIEYLRQRVFAQKVERLNTKSEFCAGIIFDLKNNHRWADKVDISAKQEVIQSTPEDKEAIAEELRRRGITIDAEKL